LLATRSTVQEYHSDPRADAGDVARLMRV
jgi:hypothetical protein